MGLSNECKALGPDSLALESCLLPKGTTAYHPGFPGRLRTFPSQACEGENNVHTASSKNNSPEENRNPGKSPGDYTPWQMIPCLRAASTSSFFLKSLGGYRIPEMGMGPQA